MLFLHGFTSFFPGSHRFGCSPKKVGRRCCAAETSRRTSRAKSRRSRLACAESISLAALADGEVSAERPLCPARYYGGAFASPPGFGVRWPSTAFGRIRKRQRTAALQDAIALIDR